MHDFTDKDVLSCLLSSPGENDVDSMRAVQVLVVLVRFTEICGVVYLPRYFAGWLMLCGIFSCVWCYALQPSFVGRVAEVGLVDCTLRLRILRLRIIYIFCC